MEQPNFLLEGLRQDQDPQYQPANSYHAAWHWVPTAGGHLAQERGARPLPSAPAYPVVGGAALGTQEILFSTDGARSEIGALTGDAYTAIVRTNSPLGPRVSVQARVDYRGHRLVYFADGTQFSWVDLDATDAPPAVRAVIPNPALPAVAAVAVDSGGELPTGVYQACVCLLTASKNAVSYSPFSGLVPVLNEAAGGNPQQLDGAPPQTAASGSITFALDHLPADYAYAQLIVATYTGVSNALQLFRLPLIPLAGRTALHYTYASFAQHQQPADLSEVLGTLADYTSATVLLQKDGRLLAAGVGSPEPLAVDWQAIANQVLLGPAVRELPYRETDPAGAAYKDPLATADGKGLQRGEVYAFCLVPVVNGRRLDAYHIPGHAALDGLTDYRLFEPYYSEETYPAGNHPTGYGGRPGIRHHRMPNLGQQPLLAGATPTGATLRVLGVQEVAPPDFSGLPAAVLAQLDGYFIGVQARTGANRSVLAQGIVQPLYPATNFLSVTPFDGKWPFITDDDRPRPKGDGRYGAFYSAETTLLRDDPRGATSLDYVGRLQGTSTLASSDRTSEVSKKYAAALLHYWDLEPTFLGGVALLPTNTTAVEAADDGGVALSEAAGTVYTWQQNGYVLLQADLASAADGFYHGLPDNAADIYYNDRAGLTDEIQLRQASGGTLNQDDAQNAGVSWRYLCNLVHARPRQYGTLEQATYYPLVFRRKGDPAPPVFNGDTFIGKVALQSNTAAYEDPEHAGIRFKTLNYYFCESTVNPGYRHFVSGTQLATGTLPYYPKQLVLWNDAGTGVMQYPSGLGHPTGYNRQYSFQNTLTPLTPADTTVQRVTRFDNRVLYSDLAVEGEQLDAYRVFRANDYHDIAKNTGPITDLWTWENSLYVHTRQALYKAYFNEATTQATSEGEVQLGNGGLFPRPSVPILAQDGGFAGCQHPQASVGSPVGRFFPDAEGQRQYLFSGTLKELSKDGLRQFFQAQLAHPGNLTASYDYTHERYVLYHLPQGAISWSARTQKWASFHAAAPTFCLSTQRRTLLDEHGLGVQNEGPLLDASVAIVANQDPNLSKRFEDAHLHCSQAPDTLLVSTLTQQSNPQALVPYTYYGQEPEASQVLYRVITDQYQLSLPRDGEGGRLKGKWALLTYGYLAQQVPALLKQLTTVFSARYR